MFQRHEDRTPTIPERKFGSSVGKCPVMKRGLIDRLLDLRGSRLRVRSASFAEQFPEFPRKDWFQPPGPGRGMIGVDKEQTRFERWIRRGCRIRVCEVECDQKKCEHHRDADRSGASDLPQSTRQVAKSAQ